MVGFIKFQAELIRKNCPDTIITTNTWLCEKLPDFYDTFRDLDVVSYDNYPTTRLPRIRNSIIPMPFISI
jgi:beta-galactosidase